MRHFKSEFAFNKYKPHFSYQRKFLLFFKRKGKAREPLNKYKGNPFKREKKRPPFWRLIKITLFAALLALWIWFMFYNRYFSITDISYAGLKNISRQEIGDFVASILKRGAVLPKDNFFFVKMDKIEKKLKENFPVENVKVTKKLPNKLRIDVEEKNSSLVYDNGEKYYLLDEKGNIIKFIKESAGSTAVIQPVVTGTSTTSSVVHAPNFADIEKTAGYYPILFDNTTSTGKEIKFSISEQVVASIIEWFNLLAKGEEGIGRTEYFQLNNINDGLVIKTASGLDILIDPFKSAASQLKNLQAILKTEKPKQYIDLRFGERVFWK